MGQGSGPEPSFHFEVEERLDQKSGDTTSQRNGIRWRWSKRMPDICKQHLEGISINPDNHGCIVEKGNLSNEEKFDCRGKKQGSGHVHWLWLFAQWSLQTGTCSWLHQRGGLGCRSRQTFWAVESVAWFNIGPLQFMMIIIHTDTDTVQWLTDLTVKWLLVTTTKAANDGNDWLMIVFLCLPTPYSLHLWLAGPCPGMLVALVVTKHKLKRWRLSSELCTHRHGRHFLWIMYGMAWFQQGWGASTTTWRATRLWPWWMPMKHFMQLGIPMAQESAVRSETHRLGARTVRLGVSP